MKTFQRWRITVLAAVLTAGVLVAVAVLIAGGNDTPGPVATNGTNTTPAVAPSTRDQTEEQVGPESVPMLTGRPLGPAQSPAPGESSGGIPCGATEQLSYHVHARLTLFVDGKPRSVPLGIGIGTPRQVTKSPTGDFAAGGSCFAFLHTHAADGIIHIEAPRRIVFKLGQFFDVWRQPLGPRRLGDQHGHVVAYVNGHRYHGDPSNIALTRHAQIQLEIGQPVVAPVEIEFPPGL